MGKKIYPNDLCPCGSGKKYKYCCGRNNSVDLSNINRSDMQMEDFVKARLYEDIDFLQFALLFALGSIGYDYCSAKHEELFINIQADDLWSYAEKDVLAIYRTMRDNDTQGKISRGAYLYQGGAPKKQMDICDLLNEGCICYEGRQVELFHAYLMYNLNKRFDEYFYLPNEKWAAYQDYGPLAHRGFDFLFAMTLYLELQLGVHVYMSGLDLGRYKDFYEKEILKYFDIENYSMSAGFLYFLSGYKKVLTKISDRFSQEEELKLYRKIGAYDDDDFQLFNKMTTKYNGNYINYLRSLVPSIFFESPSAIFFARNSYPQCDFTKYHLGLINIHRLFEEKCEIVHEDLRGLLQEVYDDEAIQHFEQLSCPIGPYDYTKQDVYHHIVFYMADELNGEVRSNPIPIELSYIDFPDFVQGEYDDENFASINPARKFVRPEDIKLRKLRLEIYQMLNGRMFNFFLPKELKVGGNFTNEDLVGQYPVLPWLSSGKEDVHHVLKTEGRGEWDDLFSSDVELRQQRLGMEIRLTEIPVNCIEEFLIPEVYYAWDKQQELLKEVKEKNVELTKKNEDLENQIKLNLALISNVSHSSVNYLNPDKLAATGLELQNADNDNPRPDELHSEGHSLIMQSEQETYLSRQLKRLVLRCSNDSVDLSQQLRKGVTRSDGVKVTDAMGFALKSLAARIISRNRDPRSDWIKQKLNKTETEWISIEKSFARDILAEYQVSGDKILDWYNLYIAEIHVSVSNCWSTIRVAKDTAFYDLIIEIISELLLNALSHGDLEKGIKVEFGEAEEFKGSPSWTYVLCENTIGEKSYPEGSMLGLEALDETLLLFNDLERGLEEKQEDNIFYSKAWLAAFYLEPLGR